VLAKASCRSVITRSRPCNYCGVASSPLLFRRARAGRRPQRPGNQSRTRAFLECPPAIHPRESPSAAGPAAIIRLAQDLSRFTAPTLGQIFSACNTKTRARCAETVDDATSLWKTEEN
jgi:hypothetical protein